MDKPSDQNRGPEDWERCRQWWIVMGDRLNVKDKIHSFFQVALGSDRALDRAKQLGGQVDYILFVILRYWIPVVLPPSGRERLTKNDPDYWLESQQILKAAVVRLRELKPLIELLTDPTPLAGAHKPRMLSGTPV